MKQLIRISITIAIISTISFRPTFAQGDALKVDNDGNVAVKGNIAANNLPVGSTTGDIFYWNNGWTRVAPGATNQVLMMRNGTPTWMSLPIYSVGDRAEGGVIFYLLKPGDRGYEAGKIHGLVASTSDIADAEWGCYSNSPGDVRTDVGTGKANTDVIAAKCGSASAAARCKAFVSNGYSDWYLPSRDEVFKMYYAKDQIGGFVSGEYWSSSEEGRFKAYVCDILGKGSYRGFMKDFPFHVRPVRSF